jgi:hypothetical protein
MRRLFLLMTIVSVCALVVFILTKRTTLNMTD